MKKLILAGALGIAVFSGMNLPGAEASKASAATTNLEIQEVTKYYSMSSYEVSQKNHLILRKGTNLQSLYKIQGSQFLIRSLMRIIK